MDERKWLADEFEEQRPRLRAIAYRMLGSLSEAEDAVQEAWLRFSGTAYREVDKLNAWLTTVVARIALNMLRSREKRSEPRVPDPIVDRADGTSPEHEALLADTVGLALLVVLETLAPAERVAFVLHDIFDLPFEEIAPIVERTPEAARQLASAHAAAFRRATPLLTPTWRFNRASSTRFLRLRMTATSTGWSLSSTPRWSSEPTPVQAD